MKDCEQTCSVIQHFDIPPPRYSATNCGEHTVALYQILNVIKYFAKGDLYAFMSLISSLFILKNLERTYRVCVYRHRSNIRGWAILEPHHEGSQSDRFVADPEIHTEGFEQT
jgi:hypothetical protein